MSKLLSKQMSMIKANQEILDKFAQLPASEKKKVVSVILNDALETEPPSAEIIPPNFSDEVLVLNAEEIFLELDQIEAAANSIRGEIWLVDLSREADSRPCLVVSIFGGEEKRLLATIIPHTTVLENSRFDIELNLHFLKRGGFNVQNLMTIPQSKLIRSLGKLNEVQLTEVERKLRVWLGI